jgi:hypothetical protein
MKEFKGTPGRWMKRGDGIVAPGDIEVAVVVNFQDDDMMNADAQLIAASPDLLAALQSLVEIYDNDGSRLYTTETKQRALDKAKVAIDKVLGETK